ncbi:type II toxin-antitoxin system VapC family toxin [Dolichospermum heterosporum]|uniref:Type II toxin-antitoxin system VapC family toxin n=1 Tax=Dolichospermum heterosporum TAC447 TaxID=747523 RepID=A0ABY5LWM1_9CYAN|nr:type II toxin-antitoxin system VapC family toxin [Dolichospermum heterosporum]UUO16388.1 type II toxin-antitoxin system VapC family toxin [Dolichospermum heterosporum TAC447]
MNNLRILDTDHLSLLQRGNTLIRQRLNMFNPQDIAITIVTVSEQIRGRMNIISRADSSSELVLAYARLEDTLEDINSLNVLQFSEAAGNIYSELKTKIRVGTQDLRIAAITLSVNGILVTRNWKDFEKVPNLRLEDWSIS